MPRAPRDGPLLGDGAVACTLAVAHDLRPGALAPALADAVTPEALAQALARVGHAGDVAGAGAAGHARHRRDAPRAAARARRRPDHAPRGARDGPRPAACPPGSASGCSPCPSGATRAPAPSTSRWSTRAIPHPVEEIAYWLRAPVRMVRTSLAAMDAALRTHPREAGRAGAPLAGRAHLGARRRAAARHHADPRVRRAARHRPSPITTIRGAAVVDPSTTLRQPSITDVTDFPRRRPEHPLHAHARAACRRLPSSSSRAGHRASAAARSSRRPERPSSSSAAPASAEPSPCSTLRRRKPAAPSNAPALPFADRGPVARRHPRARPTATRSSSCSSSGAQVVARKVAVLAVAQGHAGRLDVLAGARRPRHAPHGSRRRRRSASAHLALALDDGARSRASRRTPRTRRCWPR